MTTHPRILSRGIVTLLAAAAFGGGARAEVWNADAADNWSVATRWTPNTVPNAVGAIANFSTINITANRTVTIDTTSRTVGTLIFADATTASNDWTLAASGGATLTMDLDGATAPAVIQVLNRTATITAPLLGSDGINVTGAATGASGTLVLNAANTFTGGLTISGAIVQLNNASAAGSNTITVAAGANTASANKLAINGGLTIANNIVIESLASPLVGQGAVQAVGTGQATVNGTVTINGNTANGGHFVGGTAAGNELVLNGVITAPAAIQVVQREGRVIYKGGGTGYNSLGVTGTAIVGVNDGIATTAALQLGVSGAATLDLGAFNQAITGLTFGPSLGTVTGGTGVLTLNGSATSSGNITHVFNGNASLGGAARDFNVGDGANAIDLQAGAAFSNGTLNKMGAGTMALTGTSSATITINAGTLAFNGTSTGPVTASAGTLSGTGTVNALTTINGGAVFTPGTAGTAGTFTANALTVAAGGALNLNVGTGNDLINVTGVNGLTTAASSILKIVSTGGPLPVGTTDLISHSGPIQGSGLGGFQLSGIGHATATLQDTGSVLRLNVTQTTGTILWTGATNTTWDTTAANQNWKFQTGGAATSYLEGDDVRFSDLTVPAATTVNVAAPVNPSRVTIDNTAANPYTFTGATITGPTALTKTGAGTVVFQNILSYTGATTISAGTLEMDFDTGGFSEAGTGALGTSGISIAAGGTLRLTRDDADFTFDRSVSGAGTVLIDPHTAAGTASRTVTISGNNSGFSGTWKLSPSNLGAAGLGSFRTQNTSTNQTTLGTAAVDVDPGGQLWMADNTTLTNAITIKGTGFAEAAGGTPVGLGALTNGAYVGTGTPPLAYAGIGAIRMGTGDTISGNVVVDGNSKIMAFGQTGTISGNISSTSATDTLVIGGGTSSTTIILTGTNTYGKTFINGGSGTSAATVIQTLQIGNGGTTGTLGSGEVVVYGNSLASGRLVFQRGDAYSFPASQNIIGAAAVTADLARTGVVVNNTGPGLTLNNNTIDLSDGTNGGTISVAGAGNTIGVNNSVLNISGSTLVDVGQFFVGDATNFSGAVNQGGTSTVNFLTTMRIGHWPTETGTYNISGGSINALLAPTQFPYATTETNGGIYLGIDGAGVMVQSGGTISTNFVVLDNRGDSGAGANMSNGIDTFTQTGGTLVLKNAFGIISRNFTTAINLNGGTIQAAAGISPALDTNKIVVQSGGVTLDTNGANAFTLYGPLAGTGTVSLTNTGAGTGILNLANGGAGANNTVGSTMPGGSLGSASINLAANTSLQATRTTGVDTWSGNIIGSGALLKQGAGTLILTGSGSTFTGTTTVSGGRLDLPATFASPTISVADGAALGGEPTVASLALGSATGGTVFINPVTAGALTATNLTLSGTTSVDFSAPATSTSAPITVLKYTNLAGTPSFALANLASYRPATFDTSVAGTVSLNMSTKDLTWTGTGGPAWDVNTTTNFNDTTPAPEKFFFGDRVVFGDGPTQTAVTVTSGVSPWKTTVNSATNNYTFTSTTNGIAGPGNLEKSGASALTLVGPNTYSGKTVVSGGTLASATLATSLGNAAATNTIELSGGARLSDTGAVAFDFGPTRSITVGTGGGSISHNNATGANITISGKLIGGAADTLSFHSAAAGAGTFILAGDNSGYTGKITVDAQAAGITVLRLATQSSVPVGGSITLNFPAAGANGNATTLDLTGVSMPATVGLNLTSSLNGTTSLRTQVTGNGENSIAGPITVSGNAGGIVQFNLGSGNLTLTGNITESAPGSFGTAAVPGTVFFRGAGNTTINSTINLPTAHVVRVDNTGITTINSTGNNWLGTEVRSASTLRIGVSNALPTSTVLLIGQSTDAGNSFFDLNGFNQQIGGLNYIAGNGANTRGIINGSATPSTLTINVSGTNSFIYGNGGGTNAAGNITGNIAIVKEGTGTQTLSGATDTYTGNVTVNGGTLIAGGNAASTALGNPTIAGRSVTVNNSGSTLSFTTNNVFGNGVGNANLPSTILNSGTTLTSTRYNVLGPVTLNGATLTQSATDSGAYEGFQFKGAVTVGGSGASLISTGNGKANHLDSNTVFNVSDATGSSAVDLLVAAPLRNQSGDFGTAVGGLTKSGLGTLELSATNTYTGATIVNAGALIVSGSIAGSATTVNSGGTLGGSGTLGALSVIGGTLSPGSSPGTLTTGTLTLEGGSLLKFELAQAGTVGSGINDLISVGGNLTLDGTLQVTELGGFSNGTYRLFDYTGSLSNNILSLESAFLAAHPGSFVSAATPNQVNLTVVPEPGALVSMMGGLGLLVGLRRIRRTA